MDRKKRGEGGERGKEKYEQKEERETSRQFRGEREENERERKKLTVTRQTESRHSFTQYDSFYSKALRQSERQRRHSDVQ